MLMITTFVLTSTLALLGVISIHKLKTMDASNIKRNFTNFALYVT